MAILHPFRVVGIERGKAPKVGQQGDWYQYEIANSNTSVTGRRCGTRENVRRHAETLAENMNARARSGHSIWAPRGRRKKTS